MGTQKRCNVREEVNQSVVVSVVFSCSTRMTAMENVNYAVKYARGASAVRRGRFKGHGDPARVEAEVMTHTNGRTQV